MDEWGGEENVRASLWLFLISFHVKNRRKGNIEI